MVCAEAVGRRFVLGRVLTATPFTALSDGVSVNLRVTPRASVSRIHSVGETIPGTIALKISVTAVPEDGKANDAVIKLLANAWHLAKSDISVVKGPTDRNKVIHLRGDAATLLPRLIQWVETEL